MNDSNRLAEGEQDIQLGLPSVSKQIATAFARIYFVVAFVLMADAYLVVTKFLTLRHQVHIPWFGLVMAFVFTFVNRRWVEPNPKSFYRSEQLTEHVMELAPKVGIDPPEVLVVDDEYYKGDLAAWARVKSRRIFLTNRLVQSLTPREIRFVIAHELGHLSPRVRNLSKTLNKALVIALLTLIPAFLLDPCRSVIALIGYGLPLPGVIFACWCVLPLEQRREYESDIIALEATGDVDSAVSALVKLAESSGNSDGSLQDHPKLSDRLKVLQLRAKQLSKTD